MTVFPATSKNKIITPNEIVENYSSFIDLVLGKLMYIYFCSFTVYLGKLCDNLAANTNLPIYKINNFSSLTASTS